MNQTNRRQFLRQGAAAALAVGSMPAILAACASDDSSPSGKGVQTKPGQSTTTRPLKLTGTINFLNFEGWVGAGEIAAFEKKYPGAKINLVPWVSSDDAVAKAKNRAGDIDVLLVDGTTFPQLDALKVFAKFDNAVPNVANIDTAYKSKSWDPDNARFAATDYGRTGIAYRADIVKEAPKTWEDFFRLAETHSGKVVILDYQRSVMGSTMKSLGFAPSSKVQADIDAVKKRLIALKPHLLAISTEVGKQLANGEAVLALGDAYDIYTAQEKNKNVMWVDPSDGQVAYLEGLAVLDGPRNDLARAFVNFHLELDQYADFINTVKSAGVMPDNAMIKTPLRTSPILTPGESVRSRIDYHEFLGETAESWQTAWDAFKSA